MWSFFLHHPPHLIADRNKVIAKPVSHQWYNKTSEIATLYLFFASYKLMTVVQGLTEGKRGFLHRHLRKCIFNACKMCDVAMEGSCSHYPNTVNTSIFGELQ